MIRTYKDIEYSLYRSTRKTASILVERDGSVSIYAPSCLEDQLIEETIEKKRYWIYKQLAEWEELNLPRRKREFVDGESFPYLGRNYRLKLVQNQEIPLLLKGGFFLLNENVLDREPKDAFKTFYREKGQSLLSERVDLYKDSVGVEVSQMRIMELQYRWASCSELGNLNFHWKCMMAPLKIIDYLVVHELAHLIHPNHGEQYWKEISKVIPDYLERKNWLRLFGASLDF
jgi:predicted metal-dependent hydrolase